MADTTSFSYTGLNACTLVSEPNVSYLSNTHSTAMVTPLSSPTMGLMMLLSAMQYQAPYMGTYSNAATEASKAAYIESGGQDMQDKAMNMATKDGKDTAYKLGITDGEMGFVLGTAKVVRDRQVRFNGPKIGPVRSNLTGNQNSGSIGFKYEW